ncbi:MAG: tetratricopeptide repeat protein [Verrucomicrobia bacterium]|nr:tetratricopeptide repeat protein [Verrucomicrobiota bacterium]
MSAQQGEKLESQGSFKIALAKYRFAGSVLDQLQQRSPDWNPQVVAYRRKRVADAIQKLEEKIALEAPPIAVPPPLPQQGLDPNLLPGVNDTPARSVQTPDAGGGDAFDRAAREMRSQMAAIKQQLEQSRQQLESAQREKERIASQLEEATGKLNRSVMLSREETEKVRKAEAAKVEAAHAEAAKAREQEAVVRKQLAQSKETEAILKTQVQQASEEANGRDKGALKTLQAELESVKAEAAQAKAQLSRAQASEADLQAQVEATRKQMENQAQEKDKAVIAQTEALKQQMEKLRSSLEDAKADREVAEEQGELIHRRALKLAQERDDAASKNTQLATELETAEQKLVAMAQEREAAKAEAAKATQQLVATQKKVETVTAERDSALTQLAKANEAKGDVEKLLAENASLMKKLEEAQKAIANFNSAAPAKDQQIAALKLQLTSVQDQLALTQKEGNKNQTLIADLQKQLDAATAAVKVPAGEEQAKLMQENELLRGIVLRELKEQARREQSRKLVLGELERMKVRSKALNEQIGLLSQPAIKLTDAERSLFKAPQMEIIDNTPGALSISIAAPTSGSPTPGPIEGELPTHPVAANAAASVPKVTTEPQPNIPAELQPLAKEAKDKFNRGEYLAAERAYEKVVSQAPKNIYALSNLGVARFRAGHLKGAEETFKKVIALAPDDAFAHSTLGIVYFQQSRYDEAISALTQSVAVNSKSATAHNFLGIAAAKKGWQQAALKELETAIQLDPGYGDAHYNLAVLLATSQPPNKESARKYYKKALELGMKPDAKFDELIK